MIKLQDFATQQGVTDRQIQRLLKKYEADLEGLFERKGPNGTWLSEEACDILRGKMRQAPVAIVEPDARVEQLETRVRELEAQLLEKDRMVTIAQQQVQQAQQQVTALQEKAGKVYALEEGKKDLEARLKATEAAQKDAERAMEQAQQNTSELAVMLDEETEKRMAAEAELAEFESMPLIRRLFWRGRKA